MSPLFMCESDSPGSLSAEDCHSNNAGSEREGEGQPARPRGLKRREKNRNAARKSRKKQTERADELHEELQSLERSNSALQKEIASLKKDLHYYETTLKRHEPHCHLKASQNSSDSFARPLASEPNSSQTNAASPGVPPLSPGSLATSKSSSLGPKTLNSIEKTRSLLPVPVPRTTPGASSVGGSPKLFAGCSSPVPYPVQLSTHVAPVTSRPPSLLPNSASSPVVQLQPGQHNTLQTSACFTVGSFLPKQDSSMTALPNLMPPYSLLEVQNSCVVNRACTVNAPPLHPFQSTSSPSGSNLLASFYNSPLQAPQPFPALPQPSLEPHPAPAFDRKLRYIHQVTPNAAPLLSQLTVPSPLDVSQTTSSSFDASPAPPLQSHPPPGDPKDLSLSEFLEINDWILSGMNNQ